MDPTGSESPGGVRKRRKHLSRYTKPQQKSSSNHDIKPYFKGLNDIHFKTIVQCVFHENFLKAILSHL